jgi:hypothetical protein
MQLPELSPVIVNRRRRARGRDVSKKHQTTAASHLDATDLGGGELRGGWNPGFHHHVGYGGHTLGGLALAAALV